MKGAPEQFSRTAQAYLKSATHAKSEDLTRIAQLVEQARPRIALDVGANVGHTLRAIAPHCGIVVGLDPAGPALRLGAEATDAPNATFVEGDVAALPFRDGVADVVTCRLAAHHFPDPSRGFAELARVLAPNGLLLLSDNYSPEDPRQDAWIDELERLRDATHARSETQEGWLALARAAGLEAEIVGLYRTRLLTQDWLARSETPPGRAARVREMLAAADAELRETFVITADGFSVPKLLLAARRR